MRVRLGSIPNRSRVCLQKPSPPSPLPRPGEGSHERRPLPRVWGRGWGGGASFANTAKFAGNGAIQFWAFADLVPFHGRRVGVSPKIPLAEEGRGRGELTPFGVNQH